MENKYFFLFGYDRLTTNQVFLEDTQSKSDNHAEMLQ